MFSYDVHIWVILKELYKNRNALCLLCAKYLWIKFAVINVMLKSWFPHSMHKIFILMWLYFCTLKYVLFKGNTNGKPCKMLTETYIFMYFLHVMVMKSWVFYGIVSYVYNIFDSFILFCKWTFYIPSAKTIGLPWIRHRSDTFVSDRCLIDVNLKICDIWDKVCLGFISKSVQTVHLSMLLSSPVAGWCQLLLSFGN